MHQQFQPAGPGEPWPTLVDRAQTAGPGTINIPTEKFYELGDYQSAATVRDIPDLSFSLESLDVSAELECMLPGLDFTTTADGTVSDPHLSRRAAQTAALGNLAGFIPRLHLRLPASDPRLAWPRYLVVGVAPTGEPSARASSKPAKPTASRAHINGDTTSGIR